MASRWWTGALALAVFVACSSSGRVCSCSVGVNGVEAVLLCGTSQCVDDTAVTCDPNGASTFGPPRSCSNDGGFVCAPLGHSCEGPGDCCNHYDDVIPTVTCDTSSARCCNEVGGTCTGDGDCCTGAICGAGGKCCDAPSCP